MFYCMVLKMNNLNKIQNNLIVKLNMFFFIDSFPITLKT